MGSAIDRFLRNAQAAEAATSSDDRMPDPPVLASPAELDDDEPREDVVDARLDRWSTARQDAVSARLDRWLEASQPDPALAVSLYLGADVAPDQAAEILRLRAQTGLPAEVVARNLPRVKTDATRAALRPAAIAAAVPDLAAWMAEGPYNAGLVRDDLESLGYLHRQFRHIRDQFQRGQATTELADIGFAAILGQATPAQRRRQGELEQLIAREDDTGITGFVEEIPGAVAQQLPILARSIFGKVKGAAVGAGVGAAAGVVTRTGSAPIKTGALLGWRYGAAIEAGKLEASLAYLDYEQIRDEQGRPLDRETVLGAAVVAGIVNGALEGLTGVEALQSVPGLRTLGRPGLRRALVSQTVRLAMGRYFKEIGRTALEEGVTEALQSLVTSGLGGLATMLQDESAAHLSSDRILDALTQAMQEGRAGVQAGGGTTAAIGTTALAVDLRRAREAQRNAQAFQAISEGVQNAKLLERMPEKLQEVVERMTQDGPAEFVYAPVEQWTEYFQSKGLDPADAAEEVLGARDAYEEAQRTGSDLQIPTARYAVTIAPSEHHAFFVNELRASPTAMNAREAQEFIAQLDAAEQQATQQPATGEAGEVAPAEPDPIATAVDAIRDQVTEQLVATGIYSSAEAKAQAEVYAERYRTRGALLGEDPLELFKRLQLTIQRAGEGTETPTQSAPAVVQEASGHLVVENERPAAIDGGGDPSVETEGSTPTTSGPLTQTMGDAPADVNAAREPNEQFQGTAATRRGSFSISPDRQRREIKLFRSANRSTFLHETGHLWLEEMRDDVTTLAARAPETLTPAQRQVLADGETVLGYLGITSWDEIGEPHHERFARSAEAYFLAGQAPSSALRRVFAKFRAWLTRIYKTVRNLDVEVTPEVRQVMDRLLASEEAIAAAAAEQHMQPLFAEPRAAGRHPERAARYVETIEEARAAAVEKLTQQFMADVRREQTAEWKQRRNAVRAEVEAEVNQEPVYRAIAALQKGTTPDGTPLPDGTPRVKLDRDAAREIGGRSIVARMPRGITAAASEGGVHPELLAEPFGFASPRVMLDALATAPKREDRIRELTDARMQERYPGFFEDPAALRERAIQAVHTEQRAKLYQEELKHLVSHEFATVKGLARALTRRLPPPGALRDRAVQTIAAKRVRDISPHLYQQAAARAERASVDAFLRGDVETAFDERQRAWFNHELYRAATEARDAIDAIRRDVRKLFRSDKAIAQTRDLDYVNAARAVAARFGLGQVEQTAEAYLRPIQEYDPEQYAVLKAMIDGVTTNARRFRDATYGEVEAMREVIDGLWDLARTNRQIEIDRRKLDKEVVAGQLIARLTEITKPGRRPGQGRTVTKAEEHKFGLLGIKAAGRRVESWVDLADSGDPNGIFRQYIWNPVSEAATRFREQKHTVVMQYLEIVKQVQERMTTEDIPAPELGFVFRGKAELLGALLHTGNQSNLGKLLRGNGWELTSWDLFIRRMWKEGVLTKAEYDFVQGVWDLFDTLKAPAWRTHKALYGFYPAEIAAHMVQTPFGSYRGGYVPAQADPLRVEEAMDHQELAAFEKMANSFMFPAAGRGFTKQREERYAAPLTMNLRFIPQHIDKVLRFTYLQPRVSEVARLLQDRELRAALRAYDPPARGEMLMPWLQRSVQQSVEAPVVGDRTSKYINDLARWLRRSVALNLMVANVTNTLQQITGFSVTLVKVPPRYVRDAFWRYLRHPQQVAADIAEKSTFMRHRVTTNVIEVQQTIDDLLLNPTKYEEARAFAEKHGYFLQTAAQSVVDVVTWAGAYDQAVAEGATEADAVRRADAAVRATQGSFAPEDLARFEAGVPALRLFTMFSGYFNMLANLNATEFAITLREQGLKQGAGRLFYVYVFGFMVTAVLSRLIVEAMSGEPWDKDDDGDYLDDFLALFFGAQLDVATAFVPVAGHVAKAAINVTDDKWYNDRITVSPAISLLERSVRGVFQTGRKAIAGDGDASTGVKDVLTAIGLATRIPVGALARPVGYLVDIAEDDVEPDGPADFLRGLVTGRSGEQ